MLKCYVEMLSTSMYYHPVFAFIFSLCILCLINHMHSFKLSNNYIYSYIYKYSYKHAEINVLCARKYKITSKLGTQLTKSAYN